MNTISIRNRCCFVAATVMMALLPMRQIYAQDSFAIELNSVARISKDERVLSVDALTQSHNNAFYLAASSSRITGGSGGVGIIRIDAVGNEKPQWIYWNEFPPDFRALPQHYASCITRTPKNNLILVAKLNGTTTSISKLSPAGEVLAMHPLLKGIPGLDVLDCVMGEDGELLLVGHQKGRAFAMLFDLDLKLLWHYRQKGTQYSIFHDAVYDRNRGQFVVAGEVAPEVPKPGLNNDDLATEVAVVVIDRKGEKVRLNSWAGVHPRGAHPRFVRENRVSDKEYLLFWDTGLQNGSQIKLTALSPALQVVKQQVLIEESVLAHPPAAVLGSNQTLLLAWPHRMKVHLRVQGLFADPLARQSIKRITLAPGPVYLTETEQGQLLMISTVGIFPANRRERLPATDILVESIKILKE